MTATEQSLGGEDFSWMLQQVPGALARLGRPDARRHLAPDIHQPNFVVDERCIAVGVKVLADVATSAERRGHLSSGVDRHRCDTDVVARERRGARSLRLESPSRAPDRVREIAARTTRGAQMLS